MTDLLEKLEAAINETERLALGASGPKGIWPDWETIEFFGYETPHVLIGIGSRRQPLSGGHFTYTPVEKRFADHIVYNDPARILRRVARDRKLLARHRPDSIRLPGEPGSRLRCFSCRADGPYLSDSDASVGGAARARYDRLSIPAPWPCDDVRDLAEDYEIEVEAT